VSAIDDDIESRVTCLLDRYSSIYLNLENISGNSNISDNYDDLHKAIIELKSFEKIGVLGYAIPGAVIAVGILIPSLFLDKSIVMFFKNNLDIKIGFLINGTVLILIYAFIIRYLAVAYSPIEASSLKLNNTLVDASKLLGKSNVFTFFKIELPILKPAILSGCILVFVDVMKELPLTLILKPYHINTLAVKAYEYASDELIAEAALPSLFIILTGILPIVFLNRLISKS